MIDPEGSESGFQPFTSAQETLARTALEMWAEVSLLTFVEVPAGEGDIIFGNYDLPDGTMGTGAFPIRGIDVYYTASPDQAAPVRINTANMHDDNLHLYLHNIGHALGFDHPDLGRVQLPEGELNSHYTVMSYEGEPATQLGVYDVLAVQQLYLPIDYVPRNSSGVQSFEVDAQALSTTQVWGTHSSDIWGSSLNDHIDAGAGSDVVRGFSGADHVHGGAGDDHLSGGQGSDTLRGGLGDDYLFDGVVNYVGEGDHNLLEGGAGADTLVAAAGTDTLRGGLGDDLLYSSGDDLLEGGVGMDTLYALDGNATLMGGAHADVLFVQRGDFLLDGGDGFDQLWGGSGNDTLLAGASADRAYGGFGDDLIYGGSNAGGTVDGLFGGGGDDTLYGEAGFDMLDGGLNQDHLFGGAQADNLYGRAGDDRLYGEQGFDRLFGGIGYDSLFGGQEDDALFGGLHGDLMFGGTGDDRLFGGSGHDVMHGGAGADLLSGGVGNDLMSGNFNADTFVFGDFFGLDTITDFDAANPFERIDLSAVSAITDMADLMDNHIRQALVGVVISGDPGSWVVLEGVMLDDLDARDFIF